MTLESSTVHIGVLWAALELMGFDFEGLLLPRKCRGILDFHLILFFNLTYYNYCCVSCHWTKLRI